MKPLFYAFGLAAVATVATVCLTACSDDDKGLSGPEIDPPMAKAGAIYVLNQGNYYDHVEGSFNVLATYPFHMTEGAFRKANGRYLGSTPQCGLAYGDKLYLGVEGSNTIEILNASDCKSVKQIRLENSTKGQQPRSMVAYGGKVYISMFDGYVARLDTASREIEAAVKVGPNPDIMTLHGSKLYVPNTDGMNYPNYGTTASVVDIETFTVTETITVPLNPKEFLSLDGQLYLLCLGDYFAIKGALYRMEDDGTFSPITEATLIAKGDGCIYCIDHPYGVEPFYQKYIPASGGLEKVTFEDVDAVGGLAYDSQSGILAVASMPWDSSWIGNYKQPGQLCIYGSDGSLTGKYSIGAGPAAIFFGE